MQITKHTVSFFALALALTTGCGGGTTTEPIETTPVRAEEPITCSVPGSPAMDDFIAATRFLREGDASAVPLFERACDAGNPCGCTEAGEALVDGLLIPADVERGIALLERGCQGADAWGCYELATAFWLYRPDDIERTAELYEEACDDEVPDACVELARFRMSGIGGNEDQGAAAAAYDAGCQSGSQLACYFLGQAYALGLGVEADTERAVELLSFGCEQVGLAEACTALARLDPERRDALLHTACDAGDPVACTELDPPAPSDGTAAAALALPAADAAERLIGVNDWTSASTQIGGDIDLSTLGLPPTCTGFVGREPDYAIQLPAGLDTIALTASSDADSVIAVRDSSGRWTCADDREAGIYHARVTLVQPPAGVLAIWGGALRPGEHDGSIDFQSEGVEPLNPAYATPAAPEALAISGRMRARFYQLRLVSVGGVAGHVQLDGHDLWPFEGEGTTMSGEGVQCALGAGPHTLSVVVDSRTRTAHGSSGGPLIDVELHGFPAAGASGPTETSRVFRMQWSPPEAPATRTATFRLSRSQAADHTGCEPTD